jgi:serine/threonine protein kinase
VGLNYAFQTKDKLFLILEYCPGGDLGKVLEQEKRFDEARARIYLAEILLALEDLHKRDIIFRDLKPDNVVLDTHGHALLTDFGLSKEGVLDNQAANSFCGSVAYLAPEMLKRSGHGKSVDWYLLGVLLYEMLVGMPPYFNRDREKLVSNIQKGPLLMPS